MIKTTRKDAVRAKMIAEKKYEPSWTSEEITPDLVIANTLNWYNVHTDNKWAAKILNCEIGVAQFFKSLASAKRMVARGFKPSEQNLKTIQRMQDEFNAHVKKLTPAAAAPTAADTRTKIEEGIKNRIDYFIAELEGAIDDYVLAPKSEGKFNPYEWMQLAGVKPTHAKAISEYFRERVREPLIAESGKDEELAEGYSTYSKTRLRSLIAFIANIIKDAERLQSNQKAARKPRAKKAPSAAKVISKLNYKESSSRDTQENAGNTWALLSKQGIQRIALVTHSIHMPRASEEFKNAGFEVTVAAMGQPTNGSGTFLQWMPSPSNLEVSQSVLRELLARLIQNIRKLNFTEI